MMGMRNQRQRLEHDTHGQSHVSRLQTLCIRVFSSLALLETLGLLVSSLR